MDVDMLQDEERVEEPRSRSRSHDTSATPERIDEEDSTEPRKSVKRPRARKAGQSSVRKSTPRTHRSKALLSLLPSMPLDIMFEVFSYLEVRDVINISRLSKSFRATLLAPSAIFLWKNFRARFDAPDPPRNISEVAWVELLFGSGCQECGRGNVQKVDFVVRRRLCRACKEEHLIDRSRLLAFQVPENMSLVDLVPNAKDEDGHFYSPEVKRIVEKLVAFDRDIRAGSHEALQNYHTFRAERRELVRSVLKSNKRWTKWQNQHLAWLQAARDKITMQRRADIFQRLRELGYAQEDIQRQNDAPEVNQSKPLTERVWKNIRPILEENIRRDIKERREEELDAVVDARQELVDALYDEYRAWRTPDMWTWLPRVEEIFHFPPISELIEAPLNVELTVQHFAQAMLDLPQYLLTLIEARFWRFYQLMHETLPGNPKVVPYEVPSETAMEMLNLAAAVFECHQTHNIHRHPFVIVGHRELQDHHCDAEDFSGPDFDDYIYSPSTRTLSFSTRGAEAAKPLIQLAGLDPARALASEMDAKDLRFLCRKETNDWNQYDPQYGYYLSQLAYRWREAIEHDIATSHGCEWVVLTEAEAEHVKLQERHDPKWAKPKWTCCHCTQFMPGLVRRETVFEHVKSWHNINEPQEPQDLFYFERFRTPFTSGICHITPAPMEDIQPS